MHRELSVGGYIREIPACLKKMESLRHLSLQSPHVNELMEELHEFENIETVDFSMRRDKVRTDTMSRDELRRYLAEEPRFRYLKWHRILRETGLSSAN